MCWLLPLYFPLRKEENFLRLHELCKKDSPNNGGPFFLLCQVLPLFFLDVCFFQQSLGFLQQQLESCDTRSCL